MKTRYLRIMEDSLSAYTDAHIHRYFDEVREKGLTEHGFPRLASNIGILIAHGIRTDLSGLFRDMMEFCCTAIPKVKAANDFSVREVISCLAELEEAGVFPEDVIRWKTYLAAIVPEDCYNCYATTPASGVRNWALFSAVSEYFRQDMGLCDSRDFIDLQIEVQLKWLDENGMYCDAAGYPHQPIMYDHVSRGLFALLLHRGYRGKHYAAMDDCLRRAGLATLRMQSVTGEMAFGGRSNQFIHNEGWLAALLEYEANRYAVEGNVPLAMEFKSAALRAVESAEAWLSRRPICHVKNRYSTETRYGCEDYAYFDKYMITAASNFYAAYLICDEGIPTVASPDVTATVWETSDRFHKLFLKAGGYGLEFDLNADSHYDASGLGRVQHAGAPSALCLSQPCAGTPNYRVDVPVPVAMSLCPAVKAPEGWLFAAASSALWRVIRTGVSTDIVFAILSCAFEDRTAILDYTVSSEGVVIIQKGKGIQHHAIPVLEFDGELYTAVTVEGSVLTVAYEGWICRYTVSGEIAETDVLAANRNGHYRVFIASGDDELTVRIEMFQHPYHE